MIKKIKNLFIEKEWLLVLFLAVIFISIHIPAFHFPYHQDEYKWVWYTHPEITPPGTVPHPPLTEFIYNVLGHRVGDSNFREIPFLFGMLNFFLIFYLAKIIFNKKTALWVTFLFTISYYSLLASIMVDVDGAIMPFFLLIACIGYYKFKDFTYTFSKVSLPWVIMLCIGIIGGFLIKVSFVLPLIALALDFVIENKIFSDRKKVLRYLLYGLGGVIFLILLLIGSKFIFPSFNLKYSLGYWEHFADSSSFLNRGWLQTFIQFAKAILYTSPLLILPVFFVSKEIYKKTRPFFFFIGIGLVFYLFVFDFSIGALDRYFQFLVIPLCIISGAVFAKFFADTSSKTSKHSFTNVFFATLIFSVLLCWVQFLPHFVPALHPKSEWISRFLSLKWNFVFPFSGGSGPLGFYVSFLLIGLTWIISILALLAGWFKPDLKKLALLSILILGVMYNSVFIEEYLVGFWNGHAPTLLIHAVDFMKNNPNVTRVTSYNDNGGYDIRQIGKYRARLYTDPSFIGEQKVNYLNTYKEFYFVLDVPRVDPTSIYQKYFDSCEVIYSEVDKKMSATVYDCHKAINIKLD